MLFENSKVTSPSHSTPSTVPSSSSYILHTDAREEEIMEN
jgi:hypothetical protein